MSSLTFAEFEPLHRMAERMAHGLCRRLGLPAHDAQDFAQDILTDFLARLPAFNPGQGELGAFALTCFRHHAALLAHRTHRHRALHHSVSLDDPLPEGGTVGDFSLRPTAMRRGWASRSTPMPRWSAALTSSAPSPVWRMSTSRSAPPWRAECPVPIVTPACPAPQPSGACARSDSAFLPLASPRRRETACPEPR